ncbi:ATP-dependent DNA helicase RecQ [bacterium]|nr:ATP-dependent DNA helicase RecQ [bacterium]
MSTKATMKQELTTILQRVYGYEQFREGQLPIMTALVQGRDVLAILPTGGGKSLCFQIPGLYLGGLTLVISPLISLMQDQVENLQRRGIKTTYINSTLSPEQQQQRQQDLLAGKYQFLYLAPEKLASEKFQVWCRQLPIKLLAVDEAHCVSVWGHDFRPAYLRLRQAFAQLFGEQRPPIIALTATANKKAQADIVRFVGLKQPLDRQQSFARDNLKICISECFNEHDKMLKLLYLLQKHQGEIGIIYTLTRAKAVELAELINLLLQPAKKVKVYHGGLDKVVRAQIQQEFISGQTPVIVATNAFGMGVDQPHVRFVIHAQMSSNVENYFQEIGRGGRDGQIAHAYALVTATDWQISEQFITSNHQWSPPRKRIWRQKLLQVKKLVWTRGCRQQWVLKCFDEKRPGWQCGLCDRCCGYHFSYSVQVKKVHQLVWTWRKKLARRLQVLPNTLLPDVSVAYLCLVPWWRLQTLTVIPGLGKGFVESVWPLFQVWWQKYIIATIAGGNFDLTRKLDSVCSNNLS